MLMVLIVFMTPGLTKSKIVNAFMDICHYGYSDAHSYAEQLLTRGQVIVGKGEYDRLEPYRAALSENGFDVEIQAY